MTPVLAMMYFISIMDRVNLGYASLRMNHELGLTAAQYGLAAGLLYLSYLVCEIPSNIMLVRVSARVWFTRILMTWGVCSVATGFVSNGPQLYAARLLLGAAEAGLFPGIVYYLTTWLPRGERVAAMAWVMVAAPVTFVVGAPLSAYLLEHPLIAGLAGWRSMLIVEGAAPIVLGLFLPFLISDSPERARWLTAEEKTSIRTALTQELRSHPAVDGGFRSALCDRKAWALGFVFFGINCTFTILFWFLPHVIAGFRSERGEAVSVATIGLLSAVPFLLAAIAMVGYGYWLTGRQAKTAHVSVPIALAAVGILMPVCFNSPLVTMIGMCLAAVGALCSIAPFWQWPSMFLAGRAAASGIALIAALGVSSNVLIPWVNGRIKDLTGSYGGAMILNGIIIMAAALASVAIGSSLTRESAESMRPTAFAARREAGATPPDGYKDRSP